MWSFEERISLLKQIAIGNAKENPVAAVMAITEANAMLAAGEPESAPQAPKDDPKVYTPGTLAERWGCSERHVRNLIAAEKVPSFKMGTLIRIRHADVLVFEQMANVEGVSPGDAKGRKASKPADTGKRAESAYNDPLVKARINRLRSQGKKGK